MYHIRKHFTWWRGIPLEESMSIYKGLLVELKDLFQNLHCPLIDPMCLKHWKSLRSVWDQMLWNVWHPFYANHIFQRNVSAWIWYAMTVPWVHKMIHSIFSNMVHHLRYTKFESMIFYIKYASAIGFHYLIHRCFYRVINSLVNPWPHSFSNIVFHRTKLLKGLLSPI